MTAAVALKSTIAMVKEDGEVDEADIISALMVILVLRCDKSSYPIGQLVPHMERISKENREREQESP